MKSVDQRMGLLTRHAPASLVCFDASAQRQRDAAQLSAYARAIADALPTPAAGAATSRVVLACTDRYHFCAALVAIWLRGFTAELPENGQPATVQRAARGAHVLALLHDRDEALGLDVRKLEDVAQRAELPLWLGASDPALVAYTSGSTGQPTAHDKTLGQLFSEPEAQLECFQLAGRRVVAAVPPYHIYGLLFGVLVPLLGGGSMARVAPLQPAALLAELRRARADVLVAVPAQLTALAALTSVEPWPALARVFSSAAPLPAETGNALRARGWRVSEILGSTETGGIAHREHSEAAWRALPQVRIDIADDGTLAVDSPWLAPHAPRPLRTADRVEASEDGFWHRGRTDAVVKVGGRRIDTGELESRLKQVPGVRDARVLAVDSARLRGVELLAVVEADGLGVETLRRALVEHVDPVAVPKRYRVVPRMPRSETGKLTRAALLALFDTWSFARELLPDGRVRITVPAESGFFRGHFEGQPVLPGVVQLQHLVLLEVRRVYPHLARLERVSRVKFKRVVRPGDTVELSLTARGPLTVAFALSAEGVSVTSGILHFRAGEVR